MTPEERAKEIAEHWHDHIETWGNDWQAWEKVIMDISDAIRAAVAAEREACAKVAENKADEWAREWRQGLKANGHIEGMSDGADEVAAAIRSRGET